MEVSFTAYCFRSAHRPVARFLPGLKFKIDVHVRAVSRVWAPSRRRLPLRSTCDSFNTPRLFFLSIPSFSYFSHEMDFLHLDQTYSVLICTRCQYALVPAVIASHLHEYHKPELSRKDIERCVRFFSTKRLLSPHQVQRIQVPPSTPPIPHLAIHYDGICCRLCIERPYICRNTRGMSEHLNKAHGWRGKGGRPPKNPTSLASRTVFTDVTISPVACQTFHRSNFFRFFQVNPKKTLAIVQAQQNESGLDQPSLSLQDQLELRLDQKLETAGDTLATTPESRHFSQASPWLDVTQWSRYLHGHDLEKAAQLIKLPDFGTLYNAASKDVHSEH